jgi:isoquinoline 1-oxidoreductase alpha subunit
MLDAPRAATLIAIRLDADAARDPDFAEPPQREAIMPQYSITVNGTDRTVDVPADMPLLWVLRDELDLTGTKYGCGTGQCRSCTVHLDGEIAYACLVSIESVGEREVLTIEGLSDDLSHPVQKAWLEVDVPQCGWCQPGQVMTAAALLEEHPSPTDEQIDEWMSPVLCRCGTYGRIRAAIHRAARGEDR